MRTERNSRRTYGTGSILIKADAYHGQWRVGGQLVKRRLGPVRRPGTREGLTRLQAERLLQAKIGETKVAPAVGRVTVREAGERHIDRLRALGRKRSTLEDYESALRVHVGPLLGDVPVEQLSAEHVERFIAIKAREGKAPKSIRNYLGFLHGVLDLAVRRGWASANVAKLVDKPDAVVETRIRFLDEHEVEALLRATPDTPLGHTDRLLYLAAAMTGLRQGELLALRWSDVDFPSSRLRVRESYVRGEFGAPKSRRSTRSVPITQRLARELAAHWSRSAYQADDELVCCHPETGGPLERSRLLKRYKAALKRAGVREVRFHDLRHTFGTRMAAAGVPMRTLQEFMGHRDFKTTLIYADYQPGEREAELVERAFAGINSGINVSASETNSEQLTPH